MSLNIEDPEADRLAQAIAQETGQRVSHVVTEALREHYARLKDQKQKASIDELLAIARQLSTRVKRPYADHGTLLYDEHGLPK